MTSSAIQIAVQSVLVAFDDATFGHEAIEAAVNLAADLEAELQGLYIEDDMLLQIAELPFVQEVTTGSGTVRPIDAQSMQRAMQNKAELVRRVLEHWAKSAQIPCSFAVARGRAMRRTLLARTDSDVIFFGCRSHAPTVRRPMGLRPKSVVRPLLLLIDQSARGARALTAAAVVAQNHARPIVLLVLARSSSEFRAIELGSVSAALRSGAAPYFAAPPDYHRQRTHPVRSRSAT